MSRGTTSTTSYLPPDSVLGVIGAGQLGRMFAKAALRLGYRVHVLSTKPGAPALSLAEEAVVAAADDHDAIVRFAKGCDAVTVETESIDHRILDAVEAHTRLVPRAANVKLAGDRWQEKSFLRDHQIPVTPFVSVTSEAELRQVPEGVGMPCLLKTCRGGYDGRSQVRVTSEEQLEAAWNELGHQPCIAEAMIAFTAELSVIVARSVTGQKQLCGPMRNEHENGILKLSLAPGNFSGSVSRQALEVASATADALDYVGVLCVEMFVTPEEGVLVNELAPRPHNSGHLTLEACQTDQFEQQVRMMCGLPPGSFALRQPAAMHNLLGDLWAQGEPDWLEVLSTPQVKLHLYGKGEARPGRKMGHMTALGSSGEHLSELLLQLHQRLTVQAAGPPTDGARDS